MIHRKQLHRQQPNVLIISNKQITKASPECKENANTRQMRLADTFGVAY